MQGKRLKSRGIALGIHLGPSRGQSRKLAALKTPEQVQDFIDAIPMNFEPGGDTCKSVRQTLRRPSAHCIEGAFVAACALWMQGRPPLVMDMQAIDIDDDHVIALFRRGPHWGAISKSNSMMLRYRDPIYRSPRELAMSYFHEYCKGRIKTLRTYSVPVDLRRFPTEMWVTATEDCWSMAELLDGVRHFPLLPPGRRRLRSRDPLEVEIGRIEDYPDPRTRRKRLQK